MSRALVTGATGTVGHPIARRLAARGDEVLALVRDPARAREVLPDGVRSVQGDVSDPVAVARAVAGCDIVFHAAGLPEQWRRDPEDFTRVNVNGTRNVIAACLRHDVRRLVYTSTIDVFAWTPGSPFDEGLIDPLPRPTYYERSKQAADKLVVAAVESGLDGVFLHPSGVYGPAPILAAGVNDVVARLARKEIPMLLPGGMPVVFAEDVAKGHLAAAESAPSGSRFILSDRYLTLREVAEAVVQRQPSAKVPPIMPIGLARAVSNIGERVAGLTHKPPLIPRGGLYFLESHAVPVASHAAEELGWKVTPWEEGLGRTIEHFRAQGWL